MLNKENLESNYSFEKFWEMYPKKVWKRVSEIKFKYVKDLKNCFEWLEKYIEKWEKEETTKMFIPDPRTWLNQERYYDEIIIHEKKAWIYKRILQEKEKEKEEKKEEKEAQEKRIKLIWIYNRLTTEERQKIKNKAIDEIKKNTPKLYHKWWIIYDQMLNITIRKILHDKYFKDE